MQNIFEVPSSSLSDIFTQTAFKMGMGLPTIVEKDYWLVKLLQLLFSDDIFLKHHVFKGGTSLSKCYGLINRFSEDVDITISREFLGFNNSIEDVSKLGNKRKKRYFDELAVTSIKHVNNISKTLSEKLKSQLENPDWQLYVDTDNKQNIIFEYPRLLESSMYPEDTYVKPKILLEFGCRGELQPSTLINVKMYAEEFFSDAFSGTDIVVNTLNAERTFWEKITLLHMLTHQDKDKSLQPRMARHYYDVCKLSKSNIIEIAIKNLSLLESVAAHKSAYYRSKQASYQTAKPGSLRLIPTQQLRDKLETDYKAMTEMFFGETLTFRDILETIAEVEDTLNNL